MLWISSECIVSTELNAVFTGFLCVFFTEFIYAKEIYVRYSGSRRIERSGSDGKDNNGQVNNSKSGDFTAASLCANGGSGTAPNHISKIECTTASDGTVSAVFKTTMNPGDNFAIAASVDSIYRNGMTVNVSDGSQVINSALQSIPISGEANPNGVAGLRTNMLTVWRNLRLEIDRMMNVTNNYSSGTFRAAGQIPGNNVWVDVSVNNNNDLTREDFMVVGLYLVVILSRFRCILQQRSG